MYSYNGVRYSNEVDVTVATTKTTKHHRGNPQNRMCGLVDLLILHWWGGERYKLKLMGQASIDIENKNGC